MSLPKTYRAAQITEKGGKFEIVEKKLEMPKAGEVLVKVLACGVCHSDAIVTGQMMPTGLPRVPGHEIVGDIVAVGEGEKRFKKGDRVGGGWLGGFDHTCLSCRKGDFVTCENQSINGITRDGGYAEYAILNSEAVADIPRELDPAEAGPLLCAGVTTYNGLRQLKLLPGSTVAVQGCGGLGHLAVQFSHAMGYKTVVLSGSDSKKALAKELGADEFISGGDQAAALQKLGGAHCIVCTAPNPEVINGLMNGLAVNGVLLLLAVADQITIPMMPMIQKRLRVQGHPSGTAQDSEETVAFAGHAGVKCYVEKFPFDKVQDAFDSMMAGKPRFRAVITFD